MDRMEEDTFARRLDHTLTRRLSNVLDAANDDTLSPRSRAQLSFRIRTMKSTPMLGARYRYSMYFPVDRLASLNSERRLEAVFGPVPGSHQGGDVLPFAVSPAPSSIIVGNRGALGGPAEDQEDTVNRLTKRHIPWVALDMEESVVSVGSEEQVMLYTNSLPLATNVETEFFENVDLVPLFDENDISTDGGPLKLVVWVEGEGAPLSFLLQPVPLGNLARYRALIAGILFLSTFILIVTELIHRVYATFIGSMLGLFLIAIMHHVPELEDIIAMIDFGTLMLLFSMMVNVHLLALTGFFQYIAARMVILARGRVTLLFFLLTMSTGILSAFLDNVTTVMLVGPVTISLCKEIKRSPVPFYLSETLLATVGGTATLIGDPPNVVIGSKLDVSFTDFIM
ncbi:pink-eyed dilution protein, putative [Perkinsus marinus ATCC 50983]|uniref:Pink-eyed dilution protein, putative n=1 Tax=Perkinsus marinus (strain ATCC 50983 / TXsc) TaxID=423536 RepID=C5KL41_PERM5|nr:pink-eyed dilution protein, putative [Perkinsus marinus ATCC 50983]EER14714.1 pink-eyed dilution protein, putative [Perkinsus marinus ATCC 50983]|eukprot:XP_002782918.1 pink-eyed dilution protein, putative [Perkinsus marinus ATCC 50983]